MERKDEKCSVLEKSRGSLVNQVWTNDDDDDEDDREEAHDKIWMAIFTDESGCIVAIPLEGNKFTGERERERGEDEEGGWSIDQSKSPYHESSDFDTFHFLLTHTRIHTGKKVTLQLSSYWLEWMTIWLNKKRFNVLSIFLCYNSSFSLLLLLLSCAHFFSSRVHC